MFGRLRLRGGQAISPDDPLAGFLELQGSNSNNLQKKSPVIALRKILKRISGAKPKTPDSPKLRRKQRSANERRWFRVELDGVIRGESNTKHWRRVTRIILG